MINIVYGFLVAINIGLAVWYVSRLRRLHGRKRDMLAAWQLWEALRQTEIREMVAFRDGGSLVISNASKRADVPYYYAIWRS